MTVTVPVVEPNAAEKTLAMRWARSVAVAPRTPREVASLIACALAEYRVALLPEDNEKAAHLTTREFQILNGMAKGFSNRQISRELTITENTVKTLNKRLFKKLSAQNRQHAVAIGIKYGLIK